MFSYPLTKSEIEINQIRRAANCIGAAYAFIFLPRWLLEFFIRNSSGFARFIYFVASDTVYSAIFDMVISFLTFVPPFLLFLIILRRSPQVINFSCPKRRSLPLILIGVGICQIGEIMTLLFSDAISIFGESASMASPALETGVYGVAFSVLSIAVVPALVEEFALRGVVLGALRRHGEGFAILISSILFGLMHLNLTQAPFAFVVGLGLGFIAVQGGSVFLAVIVHFINNLTSIIFSYLGSELGFISRSAIFCSYSAAVLAIGILGLMLCRPRKELFSLNRGEGELSFKKKTAVFFSSPVMIAAMALTVIEFIRIQIG
ncbi:MAG: CPBP family intramembrane metalloprotease [Clostridia bacterium]|nr:CPBP family intramembrane metalloprotease [Clostridia bacterium]